MQPPDIELPVPAPPVLVPVPPVLVPPDDEPVIEMALPEFRPEVELLVRELEVPLEPLPPHMPELACDEFELLLAAVPALVAV
jgi:hypothetical protein